MLREAGHPSTLSELLSVHNPQSVECIRFPALADTALGRRKESFDLMRALLWQRRHGKVPISLEDVAKPVPLDPFSGRPYRYELLGAGFWIYSFGVNRADDGGDATKDIVW